MALVAGAALISPDFRYLEFSGWDRASSAELELLRQLVQGVVQPARDALGPIDVSAGGWMYSRSGARRTGVHGTGAAVDLVPRATTIEDLYRWIATHLRVPPRFGEVIREADHVHVSAPSFGGFGQVLREPREGVYVPEDPATWGAIPIPGIIVTVEGGPSPLWWLLGGLAVLGYFKKRRA